MNREKIVKLLSIFISFVFLFNVVTPVYALDELIDNNENMEELKQDEIIEEDVEKEEVLGEEQEEKIEQDSEEDPLINSLKALTRSVRSIEELNMNINFQDVIIKPYIEDNIYYFFVPQTLDLTNVNINYLGEITNISSGTIDSENKIITNDFSINNEINITYNDKDYYIRVYKSNLPSVSITLNGTTLNQINSNSKEIKYPGNTFNMYGNEQNISDSSVEIKGRGNYSWSFPKKSYQVKLSSKVNVLGMGKSKTWLLISNYGDASLMRNKTAYDLASNIGLDYMQQSRYVDLWVDGEYIGNYLLTEKVQTGSNRVELQDEDGLIVEMDNNYYASEDHYFKSKTTGSYFVLKDSDADDDGVSSFKKFKNYINEFESKLYSSNKNWDEISSMIDVESFVKFYFVQEFAENADGLRSSMFMYKDGDNDVLHMGPVWDFDLALANCYADNMGGNPNLDYAINLKKYIVESISWYNELYKMPEFRAELLRIYNETIKDQIQTSINNLDVYQSQINDSANMNFIKWQILGRENAFNNFAGHKYKNTYAEEVEYLKNWMIERYNYLNRRYSEDSDIIKIRYSSHIQYNGWEQYGLSNGERSGTEGHSLRMEAITIDLDTFNSKYSDSSLTYQTHVQNIGWQDPINSGKVAGTEGQSLRLEAIKIKLNGSIANEYSVRYKTHVAFQGWQDWKYDYEMSGTEGLSLRLEAIQIELVKKEPNSIVAESHVSFNGWGKKQINEIIGTTGQGLRLESYKLNVENKQFDGDIEYRSFVQKDGWQDYVKNGEKSGTEGKSKRIEKLSIKLTDEMAEHYDIYYRVHVQLLGWLDWAKNDEITGSDYDYRIEALEVVIVDKGSNPPERLTNQPGIIYYER